MRPDSRKTKDASSRPTNVRNVRRVSLRQRAFRTWADVRNWWHDRQEAKASAEENDDEPAPRLPWFRVFAVAAAIVCVGLLATVVANMDQYTARTQQFHVAQFQVSGNKRMTRDAIIAASAVKPGSSLMALNPHEVARTLEKMPWVRRAAVQQMLPSTLVIQVQEYQPFALLLGKQLMIVDKSGYVFKVAEQGEADDLPILTGMATDLMRAGETLGTGEAVGPDGQTPTRRRLRDMLHLIEAHAISPLAQRFPLSEVHYDPVLGTTLVSAKDGAEVRFGHAMEGDLGRAFTLVTRLLDRIEARGEWMKYAMLDDDLRPDRAVVHAVRPEQPDVPIETQKAGGAAGVAPPSGTPALEPAAGKALDLKGKPVAAAAGAKPADKAAPDDASDD